MKFYSMLPVTIVILLLASCGGDRMGEPFNGTLTATYRGQSFTPTYGVAQDISGSSLVLGIFFSDTPISCADDLVNSPLPSGTYGFIALTSTAVGSYTQAGVGVAQSSGGFGGASLGVGTVTITSSSSDRIAGTVSFSNTSSQGAPNELSGDFDVKHCGVTSP